MSGIIIIMAIKSNEFFFFLSMLTMKQFNIDVKKHQFCRNTSRIATEFRPRAGETLVILAKQRSLPHGFEESIPIKSTAGNRVSYTVIVVTTFWDSRPTD